ncbi:hypothetical protein OCS_00789 [Ophiocordyceps sinensis CO18]|uniref:Cyanovirin-N domain-containing protein n=1 Tax=Ophiocordyceps sinensis (strain Co18 / CGMCC 3.14243) TaxID=911162 RepID=T5ANT2_OPHSC|nr:hypothetical protein OCS_00789 [Ophiocordyceps sinensis CO18]
MKVTASVVLFVAALAQAAEMAPQDAQAAQAPQAPQAAQAPQVAQQPEEFRIPENLKGLARDLARFGGCFIERFWIDAQHIQCGGCGKGGYRKSNLVSCVCKNEVQVSKKLRRTLNTCVDPKAPFSNIIKSVGSDLGSIGLSGLCGAYLGSHSYGRHGRPHHSGPHSGPHPGPHPGPYPGGKPFQG